MAEADFLSPRAKFWLKVIASTGIAAAGSVSTAAIGLKGGDMISIPQWLFIAATTAGTFFATINNLISPPPPGRMPRVPKPTRVIVPLVLGALLWSGTTQAATQCTFRWDHPQAVILDQYTVYRRQGVPEYTMVATIQRTSLPNPLEPSWTGPCQAGDMYVVSATALAIGESGYSNEITIQGFAKPENLRVTITVTVP